MEKVTKQAGNSFGEKSFVFPRKPRRTIAIDFDGCLCEDAWPYIGAPNWAIINAALSEKESGSALVLWTCREDDLLKEAVEACRSWGLEFDAINDSPKEWKEEYGSAPRKIGASEYWDDRAVSPILVQAKMACCFNKHTTIRDQLDEIAGCICDEYCKWPDYCDSEYQLYVEHCNKCPVGLL